MTGFIDPAQYWGLDSKTAGTLPLGLRSSNNLFNIKYFRGAERNQQKWPGLIGASSARDQGDPQMLFRDPEDSGVAAAQLLRRKYDSGMRTPAQIIAGPMGWTPGRNDSATSVARYAGVKPDEDLRLDTPEGMKRFLPALATQEHGTWARDNVFSKRPELFDRIMKRYLGMGVPPAQAAQAAALTVPADPEMPGLMPGAPSSRPAAAPASVSFASPTPSAAPATGAAPAMTPYTGPTADDISNQRKMAQLLMGKAMDTSPVQHWTQGVARVLQGGVGGLYEDAARKGQQQLTQAGNTAITNAMQSDDPRAMIAQLLSTPGTTETGQKLAAGFLQSKVEPKNKFISAGDNLFVGNERTGEARLIQGGNKPTDAMRNFETARAGGYQGSFNDWMIEQKRAGATAITNDMRGENAEAAGIGKGAAERANDTINRARAASTTIRRMVDMQARLDQIESGKLAPGKATIGAWAKGLGVSDESLATMGIDPKLPGTAESIKAITGRMVVDMIGAGGFPANNFSDADRQFLLETVPRIANTPLGNRLIIEAAKRAAAVDVEKAKALQQWRAANKGRSVDDFELQWAERTANMDVMGDLRQQAEQLVAQSGGQRTSIGSLPRVKTPEDAARLPKGSQFLDPQGNIRVVP